MGNNVQMTLADFGIQLNNKAWQYDEDNGHMMCRCPDCDGRMPMYLWHYWNNYKFCPYCGVRLQEGNFVRRYCQIYERENEQDVLRVRKEYGRE